MRGMRVAVIVQARVASTRLPGKALRSLSGHPLLWHVLQRVKAVHRADTVILATTQRPEDQKLCQVASELGIACFQGDTHDVLERYYQAALHVGADVVARVTGDCPLVCPDILDEAIGLFLAHAGQVDVVALRGYPEGLAVEVLSFAVLEWLRDTVTDATDREHVTSYLWQNPELFRIMFLRSPEPLDHFAFSVDDEEDLAFVQEVYQRLYRPGNIFQLSEVLALLEINPELAELSRRMRQKKRRSNMAGEFHSHLNPELEAER